MNNDDKLNAIKESLLQIIREPHRWLLLVGTGTSVAMNTELGMPALAMDLIDSVPQDIAGWEAIATDLKQGIDLEKALTNRNLTEHLQNEIARQAAAFVAQKDAKLRDDVLTGKKIWVGEPLLKQLMAGLSPTWPRLPLVTPNYDMLIEYACSKANIPYITGYHGGMIRRQDWSKARERHYRLNSITMGGKRRDTITAVPRVELMKVHGSINLFRSCKDGSFIENDTWTAGCPTDYVPVIAPPGDTKIQEALNNYDRLFGEALQAINKATAYFVVGYGFRDSHIHKNILDRVRNHQCPLIVLTLDPSHELEALPAEGKNIWVLTGTRNTDDGKTDPSGTRFSNGNAELSGDFERLTLWQSDVFTKQILGG